MTAADLREWIAVFQMDLVPDGQGGSREAVPANLTADIPAAVRTPSPRLITAGDQRADRVQYTITMRYEPGITTAYRVMLRNELLDVLAVRNVDERDTWLELECGRFEGGTQ